jgi:DNA-binding FadR family transcriptional regulator
VAVAELSGNRLLAYVMQAIRDSIRLTMLAAFDHEGDWQEAVVDPKREHADLLRAVSDHDGDAAAQTVEKHIRDFYRDRIVVAMDSAAKNGGEPSPRSPKARTSSAGRRGPGARGK